MTNPKYSKNAVLFAAHAEHQRTGGGPSETVVLSLGIWVRVANTPLLSCFICLILFRIYNLLFRVCPVLYAPQIKGSLSMLIYRHSITFIKVSMDTKNALEFVWCAFTSFDYLTKDGKIPSHSKIPAELF